MNRIQSIWLFSVCTVFAACLLAACGGGSITPEDEGVPGDPAPSSNARLISLTSSEAATSPAFDPDTLGYTANVGVLRSIVVITAEVEDAGATLTVNGAPATSGVALDVPLSVVGPNPVLIQVTAADESTTRDYTLVFTRNLEPVHESILKAANADSGDGLGFAMAMSGDTLVVSANNESSAAMGVNGDDTDNSLGGAGAVYVYVRDGSSWSQQAYLKASNPGRDEFGRSVDISGDTVVVGATGEASNAMGIGGDQSDNTFSNAGAVYVFVRSGTTWSQQAYIKASNTDAGDRFGESVGIDGDTVVVGAVGEDSSTGANQADNAAGSSGAAYVFVRAAGMWSQQAYLKSATLDPSDEFGTAVDISGDTVAVSAIGESSAATGIDGDETDDSAGASGAVYVFTRSAATWTQQAYVKASNTQSGDFFGRALALDGDTLVVGSEDESSNATGVDGDQSDNSASFSGAAYVFVRDQGTWSQQAYLKASNTESVDAFSKSVAIEGNVIAIGATEEDGGSSGVNGDDSDNSGSRSGAVYLFTRTAGTWVQTAYVKAVTTENNDELGKAVAVSGGRVAASAVAEDSDATGGDTNNLLSDTGAVYVLR